MKTNGITSLVDSLFGSLTLRSRNFSVPSSAMSSIKAERVPVFPLGLVLLPRMPLPLHIFEERYRQMVHHCIEHDSPFGVLLHTGSTVQTVGCLAAIDSVINTYDDGRMDILAVGTERFRVKTMREDKPYLEADIEVFHDEPISSDTATEIDKLVRSAVMDLHEFARVSGYTLDSAMIEGMDTEELSFLLATTDVFSTEEKQQFLELRSTPDRMIRAGRAIGDSKDRLSMTRQIRTILGIEDDEDISHFFN